MIALTVYVGVWGTLFLIGLGFLGLPLFFVYHILVIQAMSDANVAAWREAQNSTRPSGQFTYLELLGVICVLAATAALFLDIEHGLPAFTGFANTLTAIAVCWEIKTLVRPPQIPPSNKSGNGSAAT
jgi:hypothetical protein